MTASQQEPGKCPTCGSDGEPWVWNNYDQRWQRHGGDGWRRCTDPFHASQQEPPTSPLEQTYREKLMDAALALTVEERCRLRIIAEIYRPASITEGICG